MATVEAILENQYKEGKKIISMSKTSGNCWRNSKRNVLTCRKETL